MGKITYDRMCEIATKALHKMLEDDEEAAMEFFAEELELEYDERKFFETPTEDEYDDSAAWEDDSDRGCKDCPPDECTGHCMSCYYRPV